MDMFQYFYHFDQEQVFLTNLWKNICSYDNISVSTGSIETDKVLGD